MKSRLICALLSVAMLASAVLSVPITARAEQTQTAESAQTTEDTAASEAAENTEAPPATEAAELTEPPAAEPEEELPVNETRMSEEGIALLKQMEGFRSKPYWDTSQYSVGYGTKCPDDKLALWLEVGITEREAEGLLFTHINSKGAALDKFIAKYNLNLNQYQYDALMLFTYNVGSGWMNQDGLLRRAVISGATGNDFIYAFVLWSKTDRVFTNGLIERRLAEANLYLNGVYGRRPPSNYSFVRFDLNGGESDYTIQGFDVNSPAPIRILPADTYTGADGTVYQFAGWYTARNGGTEVTALDGSLGYGVYLYAHWNVIKEGTGSAGSDSGAVFVDVVVTGNRVNLRTGPARPIPFPTVLPRGSSLRSLRPSVPPATFGARLPILSFGSAWTLPITIP